MELVHHVVALDVVKGTPVCCHIQHMARTLGMNVNLYQVIPFCYDHGFAPGGQFLSDFLCLHLAGADNEFRTVRIFDGERFPLRFQTADDRFHIHFDFFDLAGEAVQAAHEEENKTLPTGINYVGVFQNLQLFRRFSQRFITAADRSF